MGGFFQKLGEIVCLDFQNAMLAGGNYGGIFVEIERGCVDFQKAILAGGSYGGIFLEIWSRVGWSSKKQCWREETMGDLF